MYSSYYIIKYNFNSIYYAIKRDILSSNLDIGLFGNFIIDFIECIVNLNQSYYLFSKNVWWLDCDFLFNPIRWFSYA